MYNCRLISLADYYHYFLLLILLHLISYYANCLEFADLYVQLKNLNNLSVTFLAFGFLLRLYLRISAHTLFL
ncbi:hypothetical protein RhiirC2_370941 [Rhizophagus irregularis]|uniref:Uncharacterized protein n=1 Tax=Rhizophagus irregularis TaxID=588596 RepID=A0A2N1P068_9GLOM|nr:hypothetical protein RhiirC2_370941 [Rhizophagus irregularis]